MPSFENITKPKEVPAEVSVGDEVKEAFKNLGNGFVNGLKEGYEEKIEQYAADIRNGKPKDEVLNNLPPSMVSEVEKRLGITETTLEQEVKETIHLTNEEIEEHVDVYFDKGKVSDKMDTDSLDRFKNAVNERYTVIQALMTHPKNIEYANRIFKGEENVIDRLPNNLIYAVRYLVQELNAGKSIQESDPILDLESLNLAELINIIPQKYRDLPVADIDFMWTEPIRISDPTSGEAFNKKKAYILDRLRKERGDVAGPESNKDTVNLKKEDDEKSTFEEDQTKKAGFILDTFASFADPEELAKRTEEKVGKYAGEILNQILNKKDPEFALSGQTLYMIEKVNQYLKDEVKKYENKILNGKDSESILAGYTSDTIEKVKQYLKN